MTQAPPLFPSLAAVGLNLQAVIDLKQLPKVVSDSLALDAKARERYTQLLLIGHRGRQLWQTLQARGMAGEQPIDDFSHAQMVQLFEGPLAGHRYRIIFPSAQPVALQQLGALVGWHHDSPFRVGIHPSWGSWFAYRAVVVADTAWPVSPKQTGPSPCTGCASRPCISACPAGALAPSFNLNACLNHRKQPGSSCQDRCLARNACPVGSEHRYTDAQTSYHYLQSMPMIRRG
jgi:hypothetical protein